MELSVIIVSYNTENLLKECLTSVLSSLGVSFEVIVIDNVSSDNSVSMLKRNFPAVCLIENKKNVGFAKASNQGLAMAHGEYLLLLNSDTIISSTALHDLVGYMKSNQQVGILGCQTRSADGRIQPSAGFYPTIWRVFLWMSFLDDLGASFFWKPYHVTDKNFFKKEQEVDWVQGACMLIRRTAYKQIGSLDEEIFMYGEDVEYGLRAKSKGIKVMYTPQVTIIHSGQGSSRGNKQNALLGEYRGLKYIYSRQHKSLEKVMLSIMLQWGAILRICIFGILFRQRGAIEIYAEAYRLA